VNPLRARNLKDLLLRTSKRIGLFAVARVLTRRGLRILCYHGFELADETTFRPQLFISLADFEERMRILTAGRYVVLPLQQAIDRLAEGTLPPGAVVITIDDGFYSVRSGAAPILNHFGFPATVYVTTYYVERPAPIFRLAVGYMFARAPRMRIECGQRPWLPGGELRLDDDAARARQIETIIDFGERTCTEEGRQRLCGELATLLLTDYDGLGDTRLLSLMNRAELLEVKSLGIDVQLHTHRHRFPAGDKQAAQQEIADNRRLLTQFVGGEFEHLCYPSGQYDPIQWDWLPELGVRSATTCDPGFNYRDTARFGLRRFLDSSTISPIVFEAELSGFLELARRCRTWLKAAGRRIATVITPPKTTIGDRVGQSHA
jgi:peptidoglycan/xylan/chitin deacetylase (PgdA/CDA1 family)